MSSPTTTPRISIANWLKVSGIFAAGFLCCGSIIGLILFDLRSGAEAQQLPAAVDEPEPFTRPTVIDANFLSQVEKCLIPAAAVYGYRLRVTSGFRTIDEQDQVYEQGRTVDGHIVTEVPGGRSLHNYGFAVDVVDRYRGYDIEWDRLGRIGAWCGLEQNDEGDQAHFTHRNGMAIEEFAAGRKPPTLVLPCLSLEERAAADEPVTREDLTVCGAPEF